MKYSSSNSIVSQRRVSSLTHKVAVMTAAVMLHTSLPGGIVYAAAPAPAPAPAVATTSGSNEVKQVRVEKDGSNRIVHIETEREPAFTVFRLNDPMRLVIDIARGSVAQIDAPIDINDGVVGEIAKAQFADGKNLLGRLVIGFEHTVDYEVKGTPNGIRLMVRDSAVPNVVAKREDFTAPAIVPVVNKKIEVAAHADASKSAQKAEASKAVEAGSRVAPETSQVEQKLAGKLGEQKPTLGDKLVTDKPNAEKAIVAATGKERDVNEQPSQIPIDKTLTKVRARNRGKSAEVFLMIAGGTPAFELLELEDPPRVVVDLLGTRMKSLRPNNFDLGELGRIRLGAHADKVRLVFDAPRGIPEYEIIETPRGLKIVASAKVPTKTTDAVALSVEAQPQQQVQLAPEAEVKIAHAPRPVAIANAVAVTAAAPAPAPVVVKAPAAITVATVAPVTSAPVAPVTPAPVAPVVVAPSPAPASVVAEKIAVKVAEAPVSPTTVSATTVSAATVAVPVAAAPVAPAKPVRAIVDRIDFAKDDQVARISIVAPESVTFEVDERLPRAPVLRLTGATLQKKLERSLDVTREKTNVLRVTSFNERSHSKVISLIANLRSAGATKAYRQGDMIVWELGVQQTAAPVVAAVKGDDAPLASHTTNAAGVGAASTIRRTPEVAGFAAEAVQVAKTALPQAEGGRITIDTRGADLLNFLRLISEVSGQNIIAGDDVSGKVSLRLRNVPWEQALDVALQTRGYGKTRQGGIIRVAPLDKLQKERESELARLKTEEQVAPTYVRLIPVNYAKATAILTQVTPLLTKDRGKAQVDERTNTVVAEDLMSVLNKIETLIKRLDTQTPQVLIESRIVEANTSFVREIGIQWGGTAVASAATGNPTGLSFPSTVGVSGGADGANPLSANNSGTFLPPNFAINLPAAAGPGAGGALGLIFGNAANTAQLALRLSALENNGQVRIVSAPKIATLDNAKARIAQGVSIPISVVSAAGTNTRFVDANLELEVTPHVTQDGSVMMEIKASKNEPNFSRTGAQGDPTIEKKTAETQVLVKDGETTVIGGIYTRNSSQTYAELPWLGKIPVLGWLFKRKREEDSRAELLVFITPRIVNRQAMSMSSAGGL